MKYCAKCGKELVDEAIICTGCGCSVQYDNKFVEKVEKNNVIDNNGDNMKMVHIFVFVSNILFALSLCMILNTLASLDIGYYYNSYSGFLTDIEVCIEGGYLHTSLVFSILNVGINIAAFVLYNVKSKEKTFYKFSKYLSRLIAAVAILSTVGIVYGYWW